jgi:MFS family permease
MGKKITKNRQYYQFCAYGFLKNLRFFDPFFILFLYKIGLNYLQIGILYSIRQITINLLEIPSGIIADAFGRKKAMLFSMSSYIISFLIFYSVSSMPLLTMAMIFFGVGEAFRSGTHKAMILEYLRLNNQLDLKTRYYGSTRSCSQLGSALSALIAMSVVFYSGDLRTIFILSVVPYAINLIQLTAYPDELDGRMEKIYFKDIAAETKRSFLKFLAMIKKPFILHNLLAGSIFTALYKITKDYLQPLVKSLALGMPVFVFMQEDRHMALYIGVIYSLLYLMTSFAAKNAYRLELKVQGLYKAINISYLSGVIMLAVSGIFFKYNLTVLSVILFMGIYIVQNMRRPMVVSYLGNIIPKDVMASGLSAESQLQTIIIAVYAPVFGLIADMMGLAEAFILTGVIFIFLYPFIKIKRG